MKNILLLALVGGAIWFLMRKKGGQNAVTGKSTIKLPGPVANAGGTGTITYSLPSAFKGGFPIVKKIDSTPIRVVAE